MRLEDRTLAPTDRTFGRSVIRLVLAWAFVGVPLAWGVSRTVSSSIPLFTAAPPPAAASASSAPAAPHPAPLPQSKP